MRAVHEHVVDRVTLAARAAQPYHIPVVGNLRDIAAYQHRSLDLLARLVHALASIGLEHLAVPAQPGRVLAAAGKPPAPADLKSTVGQHGFSLRVRTPGKHRIVRAKHVACSVFFKVCRAHRTAKRLTQAPGGACIGRRDAHGHLRQRSRVELVAAEPGRQAQTKQLLLVHGAKDLRRQFALSFYLCTGLGNRLGRNVRPLQIARCHPVGQYVEVEGEKRNRAAMFSFATGPVPLLDFPIIRLKKAL